MRLTEASSNQAPMFVGEAHSLKELFTSIKDGRFTLDGRKLIVRGDFSLAKQGLTSLLGCPQRVRGNFNCNGNMLKTLEGAPQEVGGDFMCYYNQLKTLGGAPAHVKGNFDYSHNFLETLEGGPIEVDGFYDCSDNKLISLKGMPRVIEDDFLCNSNLLTSFIGCAQTIKGSLYGHDNRLLASLEGGPNLVGKNVYLEGCAKLTSLLNIYHYFPEVHGLFDFTNTGVKEHMLGLLLVRGLKDIALNDAKLEVILRKYLNGGNLLACALELINAGYEDEAKL